MDLNTKGTVEKVKPLFKKLFRPTTFFIIIILFLLLSILTVSLSYVQVKYEIAKITEDNLQLENQNKVLTEKLEKKTTDQHVEEIARERLGMIRSGERPVKIIESNIETEETVRLGSKDKVVEYMKDWYDYIGDLISEAKET